MLRAGLCKLGGHSAGRGPSCCTENHCVADANGLMRASTFPAPRTRSSVPLVRAELDNGEQLIVGDLISYQNDGKCCTMIVGNVVRT